MMAKQDDDDRMRERNRKREGERKVERGGEGRGTMMIIG